MTEELSSKLKNHGIVSRNDLADLDSDTLKKFDIEELKSEDKCANLIMSARQYWFKKDK